MSAELHFSALKQMALSPAHYASYLERGITETAAMGKGTLVHALLLGGDYVVYEKERRGNAWKEFKSAHEGRFICTQKELDVAEEIATAVRRNPNAKRALIGTREREWSVNLYGRPCAGRIDVSGVGFTADLKIVRDAQPFRLIRQCLRMAYHAQMAWYSDARRALGEDPGEALIIGVESRPPFPVTVLRVVPRALEEGRKLTRLWIEQLAACELAREWPPYAQRPVDMDVAEDAELIIDGEPLDVESAA